MAADSKIQWTERTWNPVAGCSVVSPGCTNCYAMRRVAPRLAGNPATPHYHGTVKPSKSGYVWTGKIGIASNQKFLEPLRIRKPAIWFVNSTSDLFHENVPDAVIDRVFAVMALTPQHTYQLLTKRSARMRDYCSNPQTPFRVAKAMDALEVAGQDAPEEIRQIAGYPGYFASSLGFIYSEKRGSRRRMKPEVGEQGHMRVQLHRDGKDNRRGDRFLVHRIILETFIGPPPTEEAQGRHRDGNPRYNAMSNLSWGGQSENWSDSKRHGSHRRYSKLAPEQADEIRRRHATGETGEALAREFDVSATQIRNIATGAQWSVDTPIQWPLSGVWLGVSVEDQTRADERIPDLLATPAAIRFVSAEPLLGSVDLTCVPRPSGLPTPVDDISDGIDALRFRHGATGGASLASPPSTAAARPPCLDWVIVGGESGQGARPMHPDWARSIRDQCAGAGVPYFFKQWGENLGGVSEDHGDRVWFKAASSPIHSRYLVNGDCFDWFDHRTAPDGPVWLNMTTKTAGRKLDGVEHNAMPEPHR